MLSAAWLGRQHGECNTGRWADGTGWRQLVIKFRRHVNPAASRHILASLHKEITHSLWILNIHVVLANVD
jgi:hypothetical protein